MTTWQDEQPMSRRALRESERKHAQAVLSEEHELEIDEQASDQHIWNPTPGPEPLTYVTRGREPSAQAEPISQRPRQAQPVQPSTDSASFRLRDFSPEARGAAFSATQPTSAMPWTRASSGGGDLNYHTAVGINRDQQSAEVSSVEEPPNLGTPDAGAPELNAPELNAPELGAPDTGPRTSHAEAHEVPVDVTMTRREMRALRDAAASASSTPAAPEVSTAASSRGFGEPESSAPTSFTAAPAAPAAAIPVAASFDLVQPDVHRPLAPTPPRAESNAELAAAMAEFDTLYRGRTAQPKVPGPLANPEQPAQPEQAEAVVLQQPAMPERFEVVAPQRPNLAAPAVADTPVVEDQVEEAPALATEQEQPQSSRRNRRAASPQPPEASEAVESPQPPIMTAPQITPAAPRVEPRVQPPTPSAQEREIVIAPEVSNRPHGHWSTQAGIDDKLQAGERTLSRNLAAIDAITTNALVLPDFPTSAPMTGPVGNTGEILVTGSIDLPRTLGRSGVHPARYDRADVDQLDKSDREDAAPDSAPVRAIRAVSTHTSSQGLIATKRPKGNNLPVILSITAGVMMVGVVVLVVAGMVFKIF